MRAALGLTADEALRVFRKSCALAGGLNEKAVGLIVREKRQALRRTPALSFHESTAGLDDVGGLGELKRWLRERRRAFGDEARKLRPAAAARPAAARRAGLRQVALGQGRRARVELPAAAARPRRPRSAAPTRRPRRRSARRPRWPSRSRPCVLWIDEIEKGFAAASEGGASSRVLRRVPHLAVREAVAGVRGRDGTGSAPPKLECTITGVMSSRDFAGCGGPLAALGEKRKLRRLSGAGPLERRRRPRDRFALRRARSASRSKPGPRAVRGSGKSTGSGDESATGSANYVLVDPAHLLF